MKEKLILLMMLNFVARETMAQNFTTREHCFLSDFIFNPAAAGSEKDMVAVLSAKKNWLGIDGSPGTNMLSLHLKASSLNLAKAKDYISPDYSKNGIGIGVYNDVNGPLKINGLQAAYAHHLRLNATHRISFGLSAKLTQYALDERIFKATDAGDEDLSFQSQSTFIPNFNTGAYLRHRNYRLGLSVTNLLGPDKNKLHFYNQELERTLYLSGSYCFRFTKSMGLEPKVLVRYYDNRAFLDLLAKYYCSKNLWFGFGYATISFYSFYAALKLDKVDIGYTFEYSTSPFYSRGSGNHMLFISYNLPGL